MVDGSSAAPKFRSIRQFHIAIGQVNEPALTQGDRCALYCLAAHSINFRDGSDCFPGNKKLEEATGRKTRAVQYILKKLVRLGLIEQTSRGSGGRHVATVFRIRVEDARFPAQKPRNSDCMVSAEETAQSDNRNHAMEPEKPCNLDCATVFNTQSTARCLPGSGLGVVAGEVETGRHSQPRNARNSAKSAKPPRNFTRLSVRLSTKTSDPNIETEQRRKIQAKMYRLLCEAHGSDRITRRQIFTAHFPPNLTPEQYADEIHFVNTQISDFEEKLERSPDMRWSDKRLIVKKITTLLQSLPEEAVKQRLQWDHLIKLRKQPGWG